MSSGGRRLPRFIEVIAGALVLSCGCLSASGKPHVEGARAEPRGGPRWPDVTLASSTSSEPAATGVTVVVVSTKGVSVDGGPVLAALADNMDYGFNAKHKRSGSQDLFVVPLFQALTAAPAHDGADFVFDRATPYRVVLETMFTALQAGVTRTGLVVARGLAVGHIALTPRTRQQLERQADAMQAQMLAALGGDDVGDAGSTPSESPWLGLSVTVRTEGYTLTTHGDCAVPGCTKSDTATSIPKRAGAYDGVTLSARAARLRNASPAFASERAYTLSATPSVPFTAVVDAIDALRTAPDGTPLFTDVSFGVSR